MFFIVICVVSSIAMIIAILSLLKFINITIVVIVITVFFRCRVRREHSGSKPGGSSTIFTMLIQVEMPSS